MCMYVQFSMFSSGEYHNGNLCFLLILVGSDEENNMEMQIQVKSLSLILNKPEYELAKAQVSDITAHLLLMEG